MLQLYSAPRTWKTLLTRGAVSDKTRTWGHMIRVADDPPRNWELVTRDLFQDCGPITITGISFTALEGPGNAYFDHIYLGRTIQDLDQVYRNA